MQDGCLTLKDLQLPQELLKSLLSPRPSELFAPRRCE